MTRVIEKKDRARDAAYRILNRVEASGAYADILLEAELEEMDEAERGLAMELVYGVLRQRMRIDWIIANFSSIKPRRLEHKVLNALRLGAYQLLFLTRIPPSAAVNESVNLIKSEGKKRAGFVNAVLRKINEKRDEITYPSLESDPLKHISILYSHPEWMVSRWIERYGVEEAKNLCEADLGVPPKTLRVNTLATDRDRLLEALSAEGVEVKKASCSPDGIEVLSGRLDSRDKRYYIQDEASQLIAYLVAPLPGERILDACSAPGGKTTHMAQLMKNQGGILALDKYSGRLKSVAETAGRLRIDIIETMEADAEKPLKLKDGPGFDAILCDAPCSGLGVLRRSPDIKYRRKEEDIKELSERQKAILSNLSGYVKKGGRIVYSTCTFEPEETDNVIKWFLGAHRDFVMEEAGGYVPEECRRLVDEPGVLRTYPHRHGMDGFFAARLKKI